MYDREKKVRRDEKFYSYWHLVEWRRVDGKVRQKVVEYLGPFPDRLAELTARLRRLVCGADGLRVTGQQQPLQILAEPSSLRKRGKKMVEALCVLFQRAGGWWARQAFAHFVIPPPAH
jgi:hypothetical protein